MSMYPNDVRNQGLAFFKVLNFKFSLKNWTGLSQNFDFSKTVKYFSHLHFLKIWQVKLS